MEDLFQHVYMEGCSKWKPDGVLNKVQSKADTIWISNCNWSCKERHVQRFQPLMTGLAFILVPLSEDSVTEPAIALVTCRFKAEAGSNAGVRSFRHQSFRIMSFQVHSAVEIFFFHPFLLQFQLVKLVLALFSFNFDTSPKNSPSLRHKNFQNILMVNLGLMFALKGPFQSFLASLFTKLPFERI